MYTERKENEVDVSKFVCVRLTADRQNNAMLPSFASVRNAGLAQYLKSKAWDEDERNYRAYYLVKDGERIVLYFSLQCGMLVKCNRKELTGITHKQNGERTEYFLEHNKIDVTKSIPAIELAHFCINDSYRRRKANWVVKQGVEEYSVGAYVFYEYIAPRVIKVMDVVGCQYLYLFSADDESGKLSMYYEDVLKFGFMDQMACVRQGYDEGLECMTLKKDSLIRDYNRFMDMGKVDALIEYIETEGIVSIYKAGRKLVLHDSKYLFQKLLEYGIIEEAGDADCYTVAKGK